jgi:hypothetical protein
MTVSRGSCDVSIARSERVFAVGATGSGKTSLIKLLLLGQLHIAILDTKHRFTWGAAGNRAWQTPPVTTADLSVVLRHRGPHPLIYRPALSEMTTGCNKFFSWVYSRGGTLVYVDEVLPIVRPTWLAPAYAQCLQLGRELEIGTWSGTQRPAKVPLILLTEAEHDLIFRLRNPADRKRMADYTDPKILTRNPEGHEFWYYQDGGGAPCLQTADITPLGSQAPAPEKATLWTRLTKSSSSRSARSSASSSSN